MEIEALPPAFTMADARASGLRKDEVYALLGDGVVGRAGRGVFVREGSMGPADVSIVAATAVRATATLCLTSALVHHELSDAIPVATDIALLRGARQPAGFAHVVWHSFAPATFQIGRDHVTTDSGAGFAIYSAERTIVDCFRLMHLEGSDVAHEALRRWLRRRGSSPSSLLQVATSFPKALPRLRNAMDALL